MPTRLIHGPGALARLGETLRELGVTRPLLVTDPGVAAAGLADLALEQLDDAVVFDEVRPNPDIALVDEGARSYVDSQCDGLVGLGGGSSMDTAKSIGVVARHGGSIADYEWGHAPISERIPPLVAIPTTAGTGSEVTLWAVITDRERKIKFNVGGTPLIGAHVALIDPELMLGLPATVTAATGMDALSHAIECFTCDYHQPFNDAVALQAIELVAAWLRTVVADGSEPRGAHADGTCGDARRDGVRDRERRCRSRDEPVGRRCPRLSARCSHRPRPRAGDGVQRRGRSRAPRANRAGARGRHRAD